MYKINGVKITERGWAGHFICADKCKFRRNTLLEYRNKKWIVSTVGAMPESETMKKYPDLCSDNGFQTIGLGRYYETMAFKAKKCTEEGSNCVYLDANVEKQIDFNSKWAIRHINFGTDKEANDMHDAVVMELIEKIRGE